MNSETKSEELVKFNAEQMAQMELNDKNSPQSTKALDQTEQITKVEQCLHQNDTEMAEEASLKENDDNSTEISRTVTMGHDYLPSFDDLRPEDRVECSALSSAPNKILWGKFLLCKTISISTEDVAPFVVTVTDPEGARALRLALHNYSAVHKPVYKVDFDDILPPGSFLALKNPSFKSFDGAALMLHCDNPAEVELVSRKRVEAKFPDLEWTGPITKINFHLPKKRNFWSDFENDWGAFVKLSKLGFKAFDEERLSDAIRFYDMALDYCPRKRKYETIIHSNKSAVFLDLGCFNAAIKCADLGLKIDPENLKCNNHKTKALIGLGKYEEALAFLEAKIDKFSSLRESEDCKTLLESVKLLASRENLGPTESQLLSLRMGNLKDDDNIPELISPFSKISKIEDKGRGQVATKDIRPGQLILCTKAFGYQAIPPRNDQENAVSPQEQIVRKIANKLLFDPELGPEFYVLSAGAELDHLEPGDSRVAQLDINRIRKVVRINAFESGQSIMKPETDYKGVWIAPSLFNHSCSEHNCVWIVCGEWMSVIAIADIKKGEELTLPYIMPIFDYEMRRGFCQNRGFCCSCKLCQMEASEPVSLRNERETILKNLDKLTLTTNFDQVDFKKGLEAVEALVSLRKDNVALNFSLLSTQVLRLGGLLFFKRRVDDAISVLKQMFEVADASVCWHNLGRSLATNLMVCYAFREDKEGVKNWIGIIKRLMLRFYGSLEPMRISGADAVEEIKGKFGIDFFADD